MPADGARGHAAGQQQEAAVVARREAVRDAASLLAVLLLYNLPLAYAQNDVTLIWRPAPETLVIFYLLAAARNWRKASERLAALVVLVVTVLCGVLWILRIVDAAIVSIYDRTLTLYLDLGYAGDLIAFLDQTAFFGLGWLVMGGVLAALAGLVVAGWRLARRFARAPHTQAGARALLLGSAVVLLTGAIATLGRGHAPQVLGPSSLPRLWGELAELGRGADRAERQEQQLSAAATSVANVTRPMDLLDADLFLFIVESYGHTVLANPTHFSLVDPTYERMGASLTAAGYQIHSHFLDSPAYGGNSWLADATLTTGVWIADQEIYDRLLLSRVPTLATMLSAVGFRTVNAQPANVTPWPEGDYFGFDAKYYYHDYGFRGPVLGWPPMTDQFAIDQIHRREVAAATDPLFVQYVLISSHYPFRVIPRYIPDWDSLGDGSLYHRDDALVRISRQRDNETGGSLGFATAINYTLEVIEGYLLGYVAERDALVVIVGDHQPWSGISGRGQPRSVPIHVLSKREDLLQPFVARGYTPGLVPQQPLPHQGMETFMRGLVEDFSATSGDGWATIDEPIFGATELLR